MNKCICILTSAHPIDDVRVYRKIALSFVENFDVLWIGPDFHLFENDLSYDGIERILVENKKGTLGRMLTNYNVLKLFLKYKTRIDSVYFPDPELAFFFTHLMRSGGIQKIYDVHEVYHKDLLKRRIKGLPFLLANKVLRNLISNTVRKTDLTIGVSETVLKYYIKADTPNIIVRNCLPKNFAGIVANESRRKRKFTIIHGKNHISRGTFQVLESARILKGKGIACQFLMINQDKNADLTFQTFVDKNKLDSHLDLFEGLPFKEMLAQMSYSHAGLIAYGRDLGIDSLPNRFFEYLALGIPVIVPSFSGEMVKIVKEEQCGLIVDTEDPLQLAESVEFLVNNPEISKKMGERGQQAFLNRHNWESEVEPLLQFIRKN